MTSSLHALAQLAASFSGEVREPYGAIITIVQMTGETAQAVKLEPALFTPGQDRLSPEARRYLQRIESLLRERPQLTKREEDKNGDGQVDVTSIYENGKLVRREISDPDLVPL